MGPEMAVDRKSEYSDTRKLRNSKSEAKGK